MTYGMYLVLFVPGPISKLRIKISSLPYLLMLLLIVTSINEFGPRVAPVVMHQHVTRVPCFLCARCARTRLQNLGWRYASFLFLRNTRCVSFCSAVSCLDLTRRSGDPGDANTIRSL